MSAEDKRKFLPQDAPLQSLKKEEQIAVELKRIRKSLAKLGELGVQGFMLACGNDIIYQEVIDHKSKMFLKSPDGDCMKTKFASLMSNTSEVLAVKDKDVKALRQKWQITINKIYSIYIGKKDAKVPYAAIEKGTFDHQIVGLPFTLKRPSYYGFHQLKCMLQTKDLTFRPKSTLMGAETVPDVAETALIDGNVANANTQCESDVLQEVGNRKEGECSTSCIAADNSSMHDAVIPEKQYLVTKEEVGSYIEKQILEDDLSKQIQENLSENPMEMSVPSTSTSFRKGTTKRRKGKRSHDADALVNIATFFHKK